MKNVLLTIALALFGFRAAAQDYRPFVEEGKTWRIARLTSLNDDPTYPALSPLTCVLFSKSYRRQ